MGTQGLGRGDIEIKTAAGMGTEKLILGRKIGGAHLAILQSGHLALANLLGGDLIKSVLIIRT